MAKLEELPIPQLHRTFEGLKLGVIQASRLWSDKLCLGALLACLLRSFSEDLYIAMRRNLNKLQSRLAHYACSLFLAIQNAGR
jgi:hypothetical protein